MTAIRSRSALAEERGYFTVAQVRAAEAELFTRVPEGVPMRRAAHGLARVVAAELRERTGGVAGRSVTLLFGAGDNGGEEQWAGAVMKGSGGAVRAIPLNPAGAHGDGEEADRHAVGECARGRDRQRVEEN